MITPEDLGLEDAGLALRIIAYGRLLAPCLEDLDGADKALAVAILKAGAAEAGRRVRGLKAKTVGDWSWTYLTDDEAGSCFSVDDRAVLASLCGTSGGVAAGGPVGCFPEPHRAYTNLWP